MPARESPGRGAVEVAPGENHFGEDADRGAAGGAQRDGLLVFGVVRGLGDGGEGDLEGFRVDQLRYASAACIWSVVASVAGVLWALIWPPARRAC